MSRTLTPRDAHAIVNLVNCEGFQWLAQDNSDSKRETWFSSSSDLYHYSMLFLEYEIFDFLKLIHFSFHCLKFYFKWHHEFKECVDS